MMDGLCHQQLQRPCYGYLCFFWILGCVMAMGGLCERASQSKISGHDRRRATMSPLYTRNCNSFAPKRASNVEPMNRGWFFCMVSVFLRPNPSIKPRKNIDLHRAPNQAQSRPYYIRQCYIVYHSMLDSTLYIHIHIYVYIYMYTKFVFSRGPFEQGVARLRWPGAPPARQHQGLELSK